MSRYEKYGTTTDAPVGVCLERHYGALTDVGHPITVEGPLLMHTMPVYSERLLQQKIFHPHYDFRPLHHLNRRPGELIVDRNHRGRDAVQGDYAL